MHDTAGPGSVSSIVMPARSQIWFSVYTNFCFGSMKNLVDDRGEVLCVLEAAFF